MGKTPQKLQSPFTKTINENKDKYLVQVFDWGNFYAKEKLGFEDYSDEQKAFTNEEVLLFQALQKYRTSKNQDGSYKTGETDKLLEIAKEKYDSEYEICRTEKKLSSQESYRRAEKAANDYLKEKLKEAGCYE